MKMTARLLLMAYAAYPFTKDHEFTEGDCFGARLHTCNDERYRASVLNWKEVTHERKGFQRVITEMGADLIHGISIEDGEPNHIMGCGHRAYDRVFPIFRVDEIFEMLHKHEPKRWDETIPIDMFFEIVKGGHDLPTSSSKVVESLEELMLAFYMLEVHKMIWIENKSKWIIGIR